MHPRRLVIALLTALLASTLTLVVACGSGSSGNPATGGDSGGDSSSGTDGGGIDTSLPDSSHPDTAMQDDGSTDASIDRLPFPPVISWGQPQMTAPKVVTMTFPGDPMAPDLVNFGSGVTQSAWWSTVIADYCPGGGSCQGPPGVSDAIPTAAAPVYVDTASGDPSQLPDGGVPIWNVISSAIDAAQVPAPDLNTVYVVYVPSTTVVNWDGTPGCGSFDGYHGQFTYTSDAGSAQIIYSVVMECMGYGLADVTLTASHEIVESATDGYTVGNNSGWYLDTSDVNTYGWDDVAGGEVGDLCVDMFDLGGDRTLEGTALDGAMGAYTAQRIWSVSQAKAGKNPCIPVPKGEVYFNTSPEKALFVMDVGTSRTFQAVAFSDGTGSWNVSAQDWTDPNTQYLQVGIEGAGSSGALQVKNGTQFTVTLKLLADPTNTANGEADGVLLSTDTPDPMQATVDQYWPFVVLTTATAADAGIKEPMHRHPRVHARGRSHRR